MECSNCRRNIPRCSFYIHYGICDSCIKSRIETHIDLQNIELLDCPCIRYDCGISVSPIILKCLKIGTKQFRKTYTEIYKISKTENRLINHQKSFKNYCPNCQSTNLERNGTRILITCKTCKQNFCFKCMNTYEQIKKSCIGNHSCLRLP